MFRNNYSANIEKNLSSSLKYEILQGYLALLCKLLQLFSTCMSKPMLLNTFPAAWLKLCIFFRTNFIGKRNILKHACMKFLCSSLLFVQIVWDLYRDIFMHYNLYTVACILLWPFWPITLCIDTRNNWSIQKFKLNVWLSNRFASDWHHKSFTVNIFWPSLCWGCCLLIYLLIQRNVAFLV